MFIHFLKSYIIEDHGCKKPIDDPVHRCLKAIDRAPNSAIIGIHSREEQNEDALHNMITRIDLAFAVDSPKTTFVFQSSFSSVLLIAQIRKLVQNRDQVYDRAHYFG